MRSLNVHGKYSCLEVHLELVKPIVLEGDFILPTVAMSSAFSQSSSASPVRAVFLYEESEEQFCHNFLQREPEHRLQEKRARVSWLHGQWLKDEAERLGVLVLSARP